MRAGIITMLFSEEMIKMEWQGLQVCGACLILSLIHILPWKLLCKGNHSIRGVSFRRRGARCSMRLWGRPCSRGIKKHKMCIRDRIILVHKERLMKFMKHFARVPSSNKIVEKKFVRIGEGSMTYSIGHHRFIEMARAAGAAYKICLLYTSHLNILQTFLHPHIYLSSLTHSLLCSFHFDFITNDVFSP